MKAKRIIFAGLLLTLCATGAGFAEDRDILQILQIAGPCERDGSGSRIYMLYTTGYGNGLACAGFHDVIASQTPTCTVYAPQAFPPLNESQPGKQAANCPVGDYLTGQTISNGAVESFTCCHY